MKKLLTFLTLLTLFFGVGWAADKTITITYSTFGFNSTSYSKKTATVNGYSFTVDQGCRGGSTGNFYLQMNSSKGTGTLYNTTSIPGLKSVTVNVANGNKTYTITTGTSQNPTTNSQTGTTGGTYNALSGDTYFQLKVSGASYFSSIVITYDDTNVTPPTTYDVTCNSASNGSISVGSTTSYAEGATVTVTATPNGGYKLNTITVTCDDPNVTAPTATIAGNTATFPMPASDVTISATFTESVTTQYKLVENATDLVAGAEYILAGKTINATTYQALLGAISNDLGTAVKTGFTYDSDSKILSVEEGCDATPLVLGGASGAWTFNNGSVYLSYSGGSNTLNPSNEISGNYQKWIIDTENLPLNNKLISNAGNTSRFLDYNNDRFACYTNTQSPVSLFKKIDVGAHSITIDNAIENGTVASNKASANSGDQVTLTVTPEVGYELTALSYNGTAITPLTGGSDQSTYTFTMPDADVTVTATFTAINYNIYRTITAENPNDQGGWIGNWNENCTLPGGAVGNGRGRFRDFQSFV